MKVYVVELHVEEVNQGFAYIGSSAQDAQDWIKKHGQEWCGLELDDDAYYTIIGQIVGDNPMRCEGLGQFKLNGKPGRNRPKGL